MKSLISRERVHIPPNGKRKILDSKAPAILEYMLVPWKVITLEDFCVCGPPPFFLFKDDIFVRHRNLRPAAGFEWTTPPRDVAFKDFRKGRRGEKMGQVCIFFGSMYTSIHFQGLC